MIYLDTPTRSLQAVLAGAVAATQPVVSVFFYDSTPQATTTLIRGGNTVSTMNGVTDVTILAAPALQGIIRNIHTIFINNLDTATVTVTVKLDDSGTETVYVQQAIAAGESLVYEDKAGWQILSPITPPFVDSSELIKGSADATKRLRIEVDGLTTGTQRVWTVADANIVPAGHASGLTANRVPYGTGSTGGVLTDSANLTFDGTTLTANTFGATTLSGTLSRAGDQTIDLTGALTRTLTLQNSTASQVADFDADGTLKFRNNTAFTMQLTGIPTVNRVVTFQDAASQTVVARDTTDTLTNKTVALGSNTVSGTTAQFNTALTDNDFATLAGIETLTNKTVDLTNNTLTATSLQLKTAVTDETGSGALVFATSPTLITPLLGTPTSGVLTNCTGLPTAGLVDDAVTYAKIQNVSATDKVLGRITAGAGDVEEISTTGSGSVVRATSPTLVTPALGTPVSGTLTNCTDTIVLGTEQASTSGATIDFTGIPSGTKRITINLVGVSGNGTNAMRIQLGDSGGIETTGYNGQNIHMVAAGNTVAASTAGFDIDQLGAGSTVYGTLTLILEDSSDNTWVATGLFHTPGDSSMKITTGSKALSAELDRVRIGWSGANNFDAGAINITYSR